MLLKNHKLINDYLNSATRTQGAFGEKVCEMLFDDFKTIKQRGRHADKKHSNKTIEIKTTLATKICKKDLSKRDISIINANTSNEIVRSVNEYKTYDFYSVDDLLPSNFQLNNIQKEGDEYIFDYILYLLICRDGFRIETLSSSILTSRIQHDDSGQSTISSYGIFHSLNPNVFIYKGELSELKQRFHFGDILKCL